MSEGEEAGARGPREDNGDSPAKSGDAREATDAGDTYVHGDRGAGPARAQETAAPEAPARRKGGGEERMVPKDKPRTYYDRPVVKPPVWTWEIPWYLFAGGLGGTSSALAFAAARAGNDRLARRAWAVALAGVSVSPALLISDLGRPERFLNMMRVFKVTSPMSVGSWLLLANGAAVTPAAAGAMLGRRPRPVRAAEGLAAMLGPPLATYAGTLLTNSAIPAWSEARATMPFLFAAGGAASAGAAAAALTPPGHAGPARRLAMAGAVGELVAEQLVERQAETVSGSYASGRAKRFLQAAKLLTAAGGAAIALNGRRRSSTVAGAAMLLAGAVCTRWGVFEAGRDSAGDPSQTVGPQRERLRPS